MRVQVLLSTYNGEAFLRAQLDSLLEQDHPDLRVLIRDDGSTDGTLAILAEYADAHSAICYTAGKNLGAPQSFLTLLRDAPDDADFYAFCDQDDVWMPQKVSRAVAALSAVDPSVPALYSSGRVITDRALRPVRTTPGRSVQERRLGRALVSCHALGCTTLLNPALRRLAIAELPAFCTSHDWWLYLIVSAFGRHLHDREPTIYHRRHDANVSGIRTGRLATLGARLRLFWHRGGERRLLRQAGEFRRIFGDRLSPADHRLVARFVGSQRSLSHRIGYACTCEVHRAGWPEWFILRALIILGRL